MAQAKARPSQRLRTKGFQCVLLTSPSFCTTASEIQVPHRLACPSSSSYTPIPARAHLEGYPPLDGASALLFITRELAMVHHLVQMFSTLRVP